MPGPVLWFGQAAVVKLPAEIEVTNADRIREYLLFVLNQGAAVLIADLSMTTFCDSAGAKRPGGSCAALRVILSP